MAIHPTAIVDPKAELDASVEVGPYAIIEGPVKIEADARIFSHAFIRGSVEIGPRCEIHPFAVIGHEAQSHDATPERSFVRIGEGTVIREQATVHRSMYPDGETVIGKNCLFMAYSHVAHDCRVGDNVTIMNTGTLAGHIEVGRNVTISALAAVHQFVRIGEFAMISGRSGTSMDVPPYFTAGSHTCIMGLNVVGLRRGGFPPETREELKQAYRTLYRQGLPFREAVQKVADTVTTDAGRTLVAFLQADSKRGICSARPRD